MPLTSTPPLRRAAPLLLCGLLASCGGRLSHRSADVVEGGSALPPRFTKVVIDGLDGHLTIQPGDPGEVSWAGNRRLVADTGDLLNRLKGLGPNLEPEARPLEDTTFVLRSTPFPADMDPAQAIIALELVVNVPADIAVEVRCNNGNILVADRRAPVSMSTKRGDTLLRNSEGPADVFTRRGKAFVVAHRGDLRVEVGAGDIQAELLELGPGGVELTIESGPARCTLPRDVACTVDGQTEIGRSIRPEQIWPEVEVTKSEFSTSMQGSIGGGGPPVKLRGGSSNISISPPVAR